MYCTKSTKDTRHKWSFFTTFSIQHRQIKDILAKHWKVLNSDRYLGPVLPECAGVLYRGAQPIGGEIAPKDIDPPKRIPFFMIIRVIIPVEGVMCVYTTPVGGENQKPLCPL